MQVSSGEWSASLELTHGTAWRGGLPPGVAVATVHCSLYTALYTTLSHQMDPGATTDRYCTA